MAPAGYTVKGRTSTDNLTPKQRRRTMQAVKGRGTTPERRVAAALQAMGIRFRGQLLGLPGRPDFALAAAHTVVFVHGCFWHGHGCRVTKPVANVAYWSRKLASNVRRDRRVR